MAPWYRRKRGERSGRVRPGVVHPVRPDTERMTNGLRPRTKFCGQGAFGIDEAAAGAQRAGVVVGPLGVADLASVLDQVDVGLVHLVRLEQPEEEVVRVVGGRLGADQSDPQRDPLDVPVDRHERQSRTRTAAAPRRSSCRCRRWRSASRAPRARSSRRGTRASSRRVPRGSGAGSPGSVAPSGWPRPPGRIVVDQLGERRELDGAPSPARRPSGRPTPPQPAPGLWASTSPLARIACARSASKASSAFDVGAVLGEDRQDQLARRVEPALPGRPAVDPGEAVQHEGDEPGPIALERLAQRPPGIRELALARPLPGWPLGAGRRGGRSRGSSWPATGAADAQILRPRGQPDQAGETFAAAFERGDPGGHRGFDRHRLLRDRDRDGTDRRQGRDAFDLHAAADGDARGRRPPAARRATPRAVLPNAGLGVDPALAGDDEVGAGELASRPVASMTRSTPGRSAKAAKRSWTRAARTRRRRPRRHPGVSALAPAGARPRARSAKRASRPSRVRPRRRVAPFWGP